MGLVLRVLPALREPDGRRARWTACSGTTGDGSPRTRPTWRRRSGWPRAPRPDPLRGARTASWTTDDGLPTIAEVQARGPRSDLDVEARVGPGPLSGGSARRRALPLRLGVRAAGAARPTTGCCVLLLVSMVVVFFAAHFVLSRALRPLARAAGGRRASERGRPRGRARRTGPATSSACSTDAFNRMAARVKEMVARPRPAPPRREPRAALAPHPHEGGPGAPARQRQEGAGRSRRRGDGRADHGAAGAGAPARRPRAADRPARTSSNSCTRRRAGPWGTAARASASSASPPEMPLDLDVDGVRTVLRNLLENAVKYSLPGQPAHRAVPPRARAIALVVRVTDDGPGIPAEDLAQHLRAVLPRRSLALAEDRRLRPGPQHLQAHRGGARRRRSRRPNDPSAAPASR